MKSALVILPAVALLAACMSQAPAPIYVMTYPAVPVAATPVAAPAAAPGAVQAQPVAATPAAGTAVMATPIVAQPMIAQPVIAVPVMMMPMAGTAATPQVVGGPAVPAPQTYLPVH